jgi:hypothetical protein
MKKKVSPSSSKKIPLVYVEWEDAQFLQHGWAGIDDIKSLGIEPAIIRTAGWLLEKNKNYILVAGSVAISLDMDNGASDVMKIPAGMVRKFKEVKGY